ncbi:hypothetical protein SAMN05216390_102363 [Lachnospiraceae bacterium KH1T2]|nr:hypothetical protein SAMN05216390_102363 [Lachnospiraceae bacterium KH1T2]
MDKQKADYVNNNKTDSCNHNFRFEGMEEYDKRGIEGIKNNVKMIGKVIGGVAFCAFAGAITLAGAMLKTEAKYTIGDSGKNKGKNDGEYMS